MPTPSDSDNGYDTPEEAARGDIPDRYARAISVAISPDGSEALVLLATNEEPYIAPYEVICHREGTRWVGGGGMSGTGLGWSSWSVAEDGLQLGVLRLVDEVPSGVGAVIVRWRERDYRVPVSHGYFVFTEWDVPEDFEEELGHPEAVRYVRADGTEEAVPRDPDRERAWQSLRELRRRMPRPIDRLE